MSNHKTLGAAAVLGALVLVLTGCTASGASGGSSAAGGTSAMSSAGSVPAPAAGPERVAAASAGGGAGKAAANRDIIRTGTLDLTAKDPVGAAQRIEDLVDGAAGHLDADTVHPGRDATAELTARIPASAFDATLTAIRRTGTTRSLSLRASDVTAQVTDDSVRIGALEASVQRLETLLGRASDTSDLTSLEGALTDRESDLESLQAQQRGLADQVSYASLTITVETPAAVPVSKPGTFASGLTAGWAALVATIGWLAVGIGVLLPWVVLLALAALIAGAVRRAVRRRRGAAESAPDAAG